MKLNAVVLFAFVAMLFLSSIAVAYDISSYNDAGVQGTLIATMGFTATQKNEAVFAATLSSPLPISNQVSFQGQLPAGFQVEQVAKSLCHFVVRGANGVDRIIPGNPIAPLWQSLTQNLLQCRMAPSPGQILSISPQEQIQMIYSRITRIVNSILPPECAASILELPPPINIPLAPFNLITNLLVLDPFACCPDAFLQIFNGPLVLDRAFPNFCGTAPGGGPGCGNNCPSNSTRLTSLTVASEFNLVNAKTNLLVDFRTSVDLAAISPRPNGTVTANNEDIPGYIWVRLPGYRVSLSTIPGIGGSSASLDAAALGITCAIEHTNANHTVTVTHPPTNFTSSAQILVRPINSNDQSAGVIVQCALGANIPAGSSVEVAINGLYAPAKETACGRYGLISNSAHCCEGYSAEYRYGNALGSEIVAVSHAATSCPNFFLTEESIVIARNRIISQLKFEPTVGVTANSTVEVPRYSFFVNELPSGFNSAKPTYHFFLQGFDLPGFDSLTAGPDGYVNVTQVVRVVTATSTFNSTAVQAKRTLNGGLEIALLDVKLNPQQFATVFFPPLLATNALPNTNTCRSILPGVPSQDATCCNGFRLELRLGGVSSFAYSTQCPVVLVPPVVDSGVRYTAAVCNDPATFNIYGCCVRSHAFIESLDRDVAAQCFEFVCADPTAPVFNEEVCCSHGLYRHNARCCAGGFFCPNHCCGNLVPGFTDGFGNEVPDMVGYFNHQRCCELSTEPEANNPPESDEDYFHGFDGLHKVCSCYRHMNLEEWTEFGLAECCEMGTVFVPPGGIAALPPICACQNLFDALAPTPPTDPITFLPIQEQQRIIVEWKRQYPALSPELCCATRFLADPDDESEAFDNAVYMDQYCDCHDITGPIPPSSPNRICCEFPDLAQRCPRDIEVCPEPEPCAPSGNCDCPSGNCNCNVADPAPCAAKCAAQGCVSKKIQKVDISDLIAGGDTVINLQHGSGNDHHHDHLLPPLPPLPPLPRPPHIPAPSRPDL